MSDIEARLFQAAAFLAHQHTNRAWFEGERAALVREMRLRTAIYAALLDAKERKE